MHNTENHKTGLFYFPRLGQWTVRENNSELFADGVSQRRVAGNQCTNVGITMSGGPPALEKYRLKRGRAQEEASITSIGSATCALVRHFSHHEIIAKS